MAASSTSSEAVLASASTPAMFDGSAALSFDASFEPADGSRTPAAAAAGGADGAGGAEGAGMPACTSPSDGCPFPSESMAAKKGAELTDNKLT